MNSKKFQGQVAIVTGASRGVGEAAAVQLAQAGAAVVLTARNGEQLETIAKGIRNSGGKAIAIPADISDSQQIEEIVEAAIDQFGRVDILVNNAALAWPMEEIAETDVDEWAYNIHVNLVGPLYMARNVLPLMIAQKYGRILNISSGAAQRPIVGLSAYCTSKAGLDMFTRVLAEELTESGVTANCLYPGMVDTEMQSDIRSVDTSDSQLDFSHWHKAYESKRLLSTADVARMIYWLVGPWSRTHTGQIFSASNEQWLAQVNEDLST